jgi:hypothetical protein
MPLHKSLEIPPDGIGGFGSFGGCFWKGKYFSRAVKECPNWQYSRDEDNVV